MELSYGFPERVQAPVKNLAPKESYSSSLLIEFYWQKQHFYHEELNHSVEIWLTETQSEISVILPGGNCNRKKELGCRWRVDNQVARQEGQLHLFQNRPLMCKALDNSMSKSGLCAHAREKTQMTHDIPYPSHVPSIARSICFFLLNISQTCHCTCLFSGIFPAQTAISSQISAITHKLVFLHSFLFLPVCPLKSEWSLQMWKWSYFTSIETF